MIYSKKSKFVITLKLVIFYSFLETFSWKKFFVNRDSRFIEICTSILKSDLVIRQLGLVFH